MKICKYCGSRIDDGASFCSSCGAAVTSDMQSQPDPAAQNQGSTNQEAYQGNPYESYNQNQSQGNSYEQNSNRFHVEQRSIGLAIILSLITCGIYYLYWIAKVNDEIYATVGEQPATSGGIVVLLSIITCGIYSWFWYYKMGDKCGQIKGTGSDSILYLVLGLFGLGIVSVCLMQDTINKYN